MVEVRAVIHSTESVGVVDLIEKVGDNDYIVKTKEGIYCHALFNIFNGYYYADDLYRKEDNYSPSSTL